MLSCAFRALRFTLIELMVILAVVSILASLLIPAMGGSKEKSRLVQCTANLGSLGQAQLSYVTDHNDSYVIGWDGSVAAQDKRTFWAKLQSYYKDEKLRECPANPADTVFCYGLYDALSGKPAAKTVQNPVGTVMMADNTQLDYESYIRHIDAWQRAGTGDWEVGYVHAFSDDTPTTQWSAKRPINPFVHRPLVNLLFCDGHVNGMHYMDAWGKPYKHGDPRNIWDDK